jgi:long-chain fatty acid transport protein
MRMARTVGASPPLVKVAAERAPVVVSRVVLRLAVRVDLRRGGVLALLAFAVLAMPRAARASAPELFGFSSEDGALAGAVSARASGYSAAFYNPAGLTRTTSREFSLGVLGYASRLQIDGRTQPIEDPAGIVIGAAGPLPLRSFLEKRIYVGIALYVDPSAVVRVIARAPDEPFFPYYDNRTQRLVVLPALAVRIGWGLSAGVALNYLAGLQGQVEASEGYTRAVEPRVDEAIFATARVHAGLLWQSPKDRVSAALVYRQRFSVPFTTETRNHVAGEPLDIAIDAEGLYTPDEIVVGGAVRPLPSLRLSADFTASLWSGWHGPFVTVTSDLPIVGSLSAPPPTLHYSDAYSVRIGAEWRRDVAKEVSLRLRAGYGFETSPIPRDQGGVTNLLDGFKHFVGFGIGLRFTHGPLAFRLDAHGQVHAMQSVTLDKRIAPAGTNPDPATSLRDEQPDDPNHPATLGVQVSNPGWPRITGGGAVFAAGLTFTVER